MSALINMDGPVVSSIEILSPDQPWEKIRPGQGGRFTIFTVKKSQSGSTNGVNFESALLKVAGEFRTDADTRGNPIYIAELPQDNAMLEQFFTSLISRAVLSSRHIDGINKMFEIHIPSVPIRDFPEMGRGEGI